MPELEDSTRSIIDGFLSGVAERLADAGRDRTWREGVLADCADLERVHHVRIVDEQAKHNLRMAAVVLVVYRCLIESVGYDDLIDALRASFVGAMGDYVTQKTRVWLDASADPFRDMVAVTKEREARSFGAGFVFEVQRDDDDAYLLDVRRCFWHDFFRDEGAAELTHVFCAFDGNWIEAIDPTRHGFRFERPTTLALGGDRCPFHFRRCRD
jgi:hypothetical protein